MKIIAALLLILEISLLNAQTPTGVEILKKIDLNMSSENRLFESKMIIHGQRSVRTVQSRTWTAGETKSFTEYLFPVREKGTKMLKLSNQLWIYLPSSDRTIQIAGHMLRQPVMGSDMSYEDLMEDKKLADKYTAEVEGSEMVGDRDCWIIKLTANNENITYHGKKQWIDKTRYIPLKEELFAKSGTLLKRTVLSNIENINGRWFPKKIVFKDMLKDGKGTEFIIGKIEFNIEISDYIFSKANLKQ